MLFRSLPGSDRSGLPSTAAPGYSYTGDGLDRGSCGLVISIVKDEDRAQWECKLILASGGAYTGMVDLKILSKSKSFKLTTGHEQEIVRYLPAN